uniref:Uncharacterized protein n=1 Tax=Acrobeloides nanus TaxID=290746 RepID=A0A914CY51_9BILA
MKTDGEDDEEKPSIRWAFKNPIFLTGFFEILASFILIMVTIKSNVLVLGTSYWVGFDIPTVIAIFATSPAVMGTLLCANAWYKKKNLYKAYLGLGVNEAKTCGSTLISGAEIIAAGGFYWLTVLGIHQVTFFDDWKFFTTGPIWIAMLVVVTLLCFIKKPWVYRLYLRFSAIRAGFACFILAILSIGNIQARFGHGYGARKIIEDYTNISIVLAILLVINIVFGMVVRREYKKKEAEREMDQSPPHPY